MTRGADLRYGQSMDIDPKFVRARWTAAGAALTASAASLALRPSARRALVAGGATFAVGMVGILILDALAPAKAVAKVAQRAEDLSHAL